MPLNGTMFVTTGFLFNRTDFFLRTQAFTSPTDMASSGVRENVNLPITPTFDGVCGMLIYIITSANSYCGYNICHKTNYLMWFHLPHINIVASTYATMAITSAIT